MREKVERKGRCIEIRVEQVKVGKEEDEDSVVIVNQKKIRKVKYQENVE